MVFQCFSELQYIPNASLFHLLFGFIASKKHRVMLFTSPRTCPAEMFASSLVPSMFGKLRSKNDAVEQ